MGTSAGGGGCEVTATAEVSVLRPGAPFDLLSTCRPMIDGRNDPCWRTSPGRMVRGLSTPEGPASLEVTERGPELHVRALGPGAGWVHERAPEMLGLHDDTSGFRPELHPLVREMSARRAGARFGASLRIWDALVPVVLGQRVTVGEAKRSWWRLVRRHGTPAPGLDEVRVPPTPAAIARLGVADWHVLGVERARADAVRRALVVLPALERAAEQGSAEFQRVITTVPGIGPWTATALAASVLGDPDAVLLGDLHLPHTVCWALAGEPRGSDERMLELLEPWRGHRARVVRLVRASGRSAPRRGPRYAPLPIERW